MEFVVEVLETVFQKSPAEAYRIMMQVHLNGRGVAGIYPWEVAETKVDTVDALRARPVIRCRRRLKTRKRDSRSSCFHLLLKSFSPSRFARRCRGATRT